MKKLAIGIASALSLWAQTPPAAPPTPATAEVPGDAVVATINGRAFTADDVRRLVTAAGQRVQSYFERDPKQFLRDHAYYLSLLDYAEQNGLDKKSPTKDVLEFNRMVVLTSAAMNDKLSKIIVTAEDQKEYYEKNKADFRELRVRMIYVPFGPDVGEDQAKARAEGIVKRARAGEDFVKLAKETASDPTGAGGDFTVRPNSSQPPAQMKQVLFASSVGEITDALRHDNGYYVFRVEASDVLPFEKVRDDIHKAIQNLQFEQWQKQVREGSSVQFENEKFFENIGRK